MIDIKLRYQAIIFVQASDIVPDSDHIVKLVTAFRDKELVPGTFQEIGLQGLVPVARLLLSNTSGEWIVEFASNQIRITRQGGIEPSKSDIGELDRFCADASDFFERILQIYPKRANRLAIIANYLLDEMSPQTLSDIYLRLLRPPIFYENNMPFEWDWRSVAKVYFGSWSRNEYLNAITLVQCRQGQVAIPEIAIPPNRMQLSFDINTIPQSTEYRFELPHIKTFYRDIVAFHDTLQKQMLDLIDGKKND